MEKMSSSTLSLIENLLYWSRSQINEMRPQPSVCNLTQIISDLIKTVQSKADFKNIKIEHNILIEHIAYCDKDMIGLVIRNILVNALKFTSAGGCIKISVSEANNYIEVVISDNGVGFNKNDIACSLSKKVLTSTLGTEHENGSGFGLLLCKELLALNNGKLGFDSKPNEGSIFTISVPKKEGTVSVNNLQ